LTGFCDFLIKMFQIKLQSNLSIVHKPRFMRFFSTPSIALYPGSTVVFFNKQQLLVLLKKAYLSSFLPKIIFINPFCPINSKLNTVYWFLTIKFQITSKLTHNTIKLIIFKKTKHFQKPKDLRYLFYFLCS
jgi:hypothetical protein